VGGHVTQGQVIGSMGLHMDRGVLELELRETANGSQPVNPAPLFDLSGMTSGFLQRPMSNFFARNAGVQGAGPLGRSGEITHAADVFGRSQSELERDARFAHNWDIIEGEEVYLRRLVEYHFHSNNMAAVGHTLDDVLQWCGETGTVTVRLFGTTHVFMPPEVYEGRNARGLFAPFSDVPTDDDVQEHAFLRIENDRVVVLGTVFFGDGTRYELSGDLEWYVYHDKYLDIRMYTTPERVPTFGSFRNVYVGIARDMAGNSDIGEVFVLANDAWEYVGQLSFAVQGAHSRATGITGFSLDIPTEIYESEGRGGVRNAVIITTPDDVASARVFQGFLFDGTEAGRALRNVLYLYLGMMDAGIDMADDAWVMALVTFGRYKDEIERLLENPIRNMPTLISFVNPKNAATYFSLYFLIQDIQSLVQFIALMRYEEDLTAIELALALGSMAGNIAHDAIFGDLIESLVYLTENEVYSQPLYTLQPHEARELGRHLAIIAVRSYAIGVAAKYAGAKISAWIAKPAIALPTTQLQFVQSITIKYGAHNIHTVTVVTNLGTYKITYVVVPVASGSATSAPALINHFTLMYGGIAKVEFVPSLASAGGAPAIRLTPLAGVIALDPLPQPPARGFFLGRDAELFFMEHFGGVEQQRFRTDLGWRYVDVLTENLRHANEIKVGYVRYTYFYKNQALKDSLLITDGIVDNVTWHFFKSSETGRIGADLRFLEFLDSLGINYLMHP